MGSEAVEAGSRDSLKTISAIRGLLEKLGAEVGGLRRTLPGPSHTMRNTDLLDAHAHSLKHLSKGLQEALTKGY